MDPQKRFLSEEVYDTKQRQYTNKPCLNNNGRLWKGNILSVGFSFFNFNLNFTFPHWQYHEGKEQRNTFYL